MDPVRILATLVVHTPGYSVRPSDLLEGEGRTLESEYYLEYVYYELCIKYVYARKVGREFFACR